MGYELVDLSSSVATTVLALGYELVDLERLPRGLVRVTIDCDRPGGVTLDDCELVSDQLTALFAVENVSYERLEVSSPGVERPLRTAADWRRFIGHPARVELVEPLRHEAFPAAGRRRLEGTILAVSDGPGDPIVHFRSERLDIPRTPSQAVRQKRSRRSPDGDSGTVEVAFPVSAVVRAHLLALLDFRGKGK